MLFNQMPQYQTTLTAVPTQDELRQLPQFYRASEAFARQHGGPHIAAILDSIHYSRKWKHISIDSRLSMLMRDMYPCIPGWHCDDFYRKSRTSQPDLSIIDEEAPSEHFLLIWGECSKTRFVDESLELPHTSPDNESYYGRCHRLIEALTPKTLTVEPGEIWKFSPLAWHRGEPASHPGWRYFIRITGSDHREAKDEVRTQTQVYMTDPFAGW